MQESSGHRAAPSLSRRRWLQQSGAAALLPATALGLARPGRAAAQPVATLVLATTPGLDSAPMTVAQELGIYGRHGLDLKSEAPASGIDATNRVIARNADLATVGAVVTFTAYTRGLPVRVVGLVHSRAASDSYATSRIVASPKAGIGPGEVAKLKGRKVGLLVGTDPDGALRAWLSTAGLTIKDVQVVNVRFPDSPSALSTGSVDAVCVIEPWAAVCQLEVGAVPVTAPGQYPPIFMPGLIVTGTDTLAKRRGELQRFLTAFAEAQQWSRKNPDKAIDINLARVKTLTADASRLSLKTISWDMRLTRRSLAGLVERTVPILAQSGVLREDVNAAALVGQIVDPTLTLDVQRKHPELFDDLPPIPAGEQL